LVHNEAGRQKALLEIRQKIRARGVRSDNFQPQFFDVTDILRQTSYFPIKNALTENTRIKCVRLPFFEGILSYPTQPGTNFAKEFADRVRVIACLDTIPNLIHSDTGDETISSASWEKIKRLTGFKSSDALIITWGNEADVETAVKEIEIRAREAIEGVPSETRQALADGTTGFERILPGPDRMYPDTDLPPIALEEERIRRIQSNLPVLPWERRKKYSEYGLPEKTIDELILSNIGNWLDAILENTKIKPAFPAKVLTDYRKYWRRKGLPVERLNETIIVEIFRAYDEKKIVREAVPIILVNFMENSTISIEQLIEEYKPLPASEIKRIVEDKIKILEIDSDLPKQKKMEIAMGEIMKEIRGKAEGKEVAKLVRKHI
jgi:glutamyl-tRNA(Gln) amidotransferase subunit E